MELSSQYIANIFERGMCFSRIRLTFPYIENSCEINPSHMVFMIFNFAQCIYHD